MIAKLPKPSTERGHSTITGIKPPAGTTSPGAGTASTVDIIEGRPYATRVKDSKGTQPMDTKRPGPGAKGHMTDPMATKGPGGMKATSGSSEKGGDPGSMKGGGNMDPGYRRGEGGMGGKKGRRK
jgi:hypothetical protein